MLLSRWMLRLFVVVLPILAGTSGSAEEFRDHALETFDRVWQIVRDTHFDPDLNGVDWDEVKAELRPDAGEAKNNGDLRRVVTSMLSRLGQSHFAIVPGETEWPEDASADERALEEALAAIPAFESRATPGIDVRLLDDRVVVSEVREGHPAAFAGVKTGWQILTLDGQPMSDSLKYISDEMKRRGMGDALEREHAVIVWGFVRSRLAGEEGSRIDVEFLKGDGSRESLELARKPSSWPMEATGGMPAFPVEVTSRTVAPSITVIRIVGMWLLGVVPAFDEAFGRSRSSRGMILDLRGNLGGISTIGQAVAGAFVSKQERLGKFVMRGQEIPMPILPRKVSHGDEILEPYDGPLAILIDGQSGSTTELFAAALQDMGRALIFGEPSMGAALPSALTPLPNGDKLLHAIADFIRPSGGSLEGHPVVPDHASPLTRESLLEGRDLAMESAVQWIEKVSGKDR